MKLTDPTVLASLVLGVIAVAWALFHRRTETHSGPCWESVPAVEDGQVIGYQVRWSEPDASGRFLWVGHYFADPDRSLRWCENASERHAERWNDERRRPWEWRL